MTIYWIDFKIPDKMLAFFVHFTTKGLLTTSEF